MRAEPAELELRLNYRFKDPELLRRALMHSSLANELRTTGAVATDNEQMEFLGDSVLGFLVADALVRRSPGAREGELSRQKAHLVSAAHLHGVAPVGAEHLRPVPVGRHQQGTVRAGEAGQVADVDQPAHQHRVQPGGPGGGTQSVPAFG